jgi:hypothetical protein
VLLCSWTGRGEGGARLAGAARDQPLADELVFSKVWLPQCCCSLRRTTAAALVTGRLQRLGLAARPRPALGTHLLPAAAACRACSRPLQPARSCGCLREAAAGWCSASKAPNAHAQLQAAPSASSRLSVTPASAAGNSSSAVSRGCMAVGLAVRRPPSRVGWGWHQRWLAVRQGRWSRCAATHTGTEQEQEQEHGGV